VLEASRVEVGAGDDLRVLERIEIPDEVGSPIAATDNSDA